MKKEQISQILESTLKSGNKMPGIMDLPKVFALKTKLQSCNSTGEVLTIIEQNRDLISKSFGLNMDAIDSAVAKIAAL